MSGKEILMQFGQSPKIAAVASAMTAGTGISTVLDFIPGDIGKLASLVGIGLSIILIRLHMINIQKGKIELEMKRNELRMQRNKMIDDDIR